MIFRISRVIIFFLIFSLISVVTQASFISECENIKYVFNAADVVVWGEVVKVESKNEGGQIFTYVDILAKQYLKGKSDSVITVKQFGGSVGDLGISDADRPFFEKGQSGYFYLRKPREDKFYEGRWYGTVCGYGVTDALPSGIGKDGQ